MGLRDSSYLRQVASEDRVPQCLDGLRPRIAPAPGERHAAARNRTREGPDANQVALAPCGYRSRGEDGDADAARHHLADRLQRPSLERPPDRAASRATR